ncbi:MAG TPA: HEAT repeat domain-containing protein [Pyrinomonadaceae bacterium]|nr:HEAT repeat domain-containing protein [Pyrinomonadaceae bacterium]
MVQGRLLAACEAEPEKLPGLLPLLADAPRVAERVKKLYDAAQGDERLDEGWRKSVREWLLFNSTYFQSELLSNAGKAKDKEGYVENEEALKALAKVDWSSAEPLLRSLSGGEQPRTAAFALALLHRHALENKDTGGEERFRTIMQAVASDRSAPARARDTAVEELSQTEWPGRDEWYLSLFADETLLSPSDGHYGFSPLTTLFDRDPDRWIPVMTKLVESKDAAVRQNAANCLVQFVNDGGPRSKRRDAALPVLRWLSDPDWLPINSTYRAWFMQHIDELDMREAVPGLIWIVEHEEWNRHWAARTLAHYKDPRAVPALRKALAEEKGEDYRRYILRGLIASGGLTEAEQLGALEAYAAKLMTTGGREEVERYRARGDEPLPQPVSIGNYLSKQKDIPEALAQAVIARAELLGKKNPAQARALLGVAEGWQARRVELDIVRRIGSGTADAATVSNALERRVRLRESVGPELQLLVAAGGSAQGMAAVTLENEPLAQSILASGDEAAQIALLACARLVQMPLPVARVGSLLLNKNADLALAAERYLSAEDSRESRELLWARHPGEAFITGWRENIPLIGGSDFSGMDRAEEKLHAELFRKDDAPLEIFALLGNHERPLHVLRVYAGKSVYTHYEDDSRYRERVVTGEELERFKQFVTSNNLPDFGPQFGPCHHDCRVSEFLLLKREGGRRVFSHQGMGGWLTVLDNFDLLGSGDAKVHYRLAEQIRGLEVLIADEGLAVKDIWRRDADLRVLVERAETEEEVERQEVVANDSGGEEEDDAAARANRHREETERARAQVSWRDFSGSKLGEAAARPEVYQTFDEDTLGVDAEKFPSHLNSRLAQAAAGKYYVLAGDLDRGGLWKKAAGQNAFRISSGEGVYANPLVTPDGLWAVSAKAESDWGRPNYVVRFNLATGREYRVNLPPAEQFEPVAYVAAHGKVLLRRACDEGSAGESRGRASPEYYLLDAQTGRTELVPGVFAPLLQEGNRPLQPTGRTDEFWVAVPDREKNETRVGRYSTKDFSLRTLVVVPHITFDSFGMLVDEEGAKLYLVYEGELLRLPMPRTL